MATTEEWDQALDLNVFNTASWALQVEDVGRKSGTM